MKRGKDILEEYMDLEKSCLSDTEKRNMMDIYKKNIVIQGSKYQNDEVQTSFHHEDNMATSGLWKLLHLPIFILNENGTSGCVMSET